MKFPRIILALTAILLVSCDKSNNNEAIASIADHWHVWDFEPNSSTDTTLLAKEAILELVEVGCDPIEFTFKSDGKVSYRNGMKYVEPFMEEEGVLVDCASNYDDEVGTFDFDYTKLTLNFETRTLVYQVTVEGDYFSAQVDDIFINGAVVSGKLIFRRETSN